MKQTRKEELEEMEIPGLFVKIVVVTEATLVGILFGLMLYMVIENIGPYMDSQNWYYWR